MASSQRERGLTNHAAVNAADREEEGKEENLETKHSQPESNMVDQATWEANTMFGGVNGWGNDSAAPSAPLMLGISDGNASITTQHNMKF